MPTLELLAMIKTLTDERDEARRAADLWHKKCLGARSLAAQQHFGFDPNPIRNPELFIIDGFCNAWFRWCQNCGREMQIVRQGEAQCARCGK